MRGPHNILRLIRTGATFERTGAMGAVLDAVEAPPRLRLLPGSIVHKRHIVFALNAALLKRPRRDGRTGPFRCEARERMLNSGVSRGCSSAGRAHDWQS